FAQTSHDYLLLDTIFFFSDEEIVGNIQPVACVWKDELLFSNFNQYKSSDTMLFYSVNIETKKIDTICLYRNGIRNYLMESYSKNLRYIAYNRQYIVIGIFEKALCYKRQKTGVYLFEKELLLDQYMVSKAWFLDSNTLLFVNVQNSKESPVYLYKYDVKQKTITKIIYPYFNTLLLSYFKPEHLIDVKENIVLFANRNEYSILLYNTALNLTDSLSETVHGWISLKAKTIDKINKKYPKTDAMNIINAIDKYYSNIYQLQWVYIINANKLLSVYTPSQDKKDLFKKGLPIINIWKKINNQWFITQKNIQDDIRLVYENDTITKKSFPVGFLSGCQMFFTNNKAVIIENSGTDINPIGLHKNDYGEKLMDYAREKNFIMKINIFTHTF
ncbi:MAG: hypothetical protein LBE13_06185, partial [Bacteroidales bacterium]|nr:hypothetical protein [Bacteroidales bacterium]